MDDHTRRAARFYAERDRRSRQLGVLDAATDIPVHITFSQELAENRTAHVALLALVNMVSRLHRRLCISAPDVPLLAKPLVPATSLRSSLLATARAIDPFIVLSEESVEGKGLSIRVGDGQAWYLGAEGARGTLAAGLQPFSVGNQSVLGAGMSACLAAAAACKSALGRSVAAARVSAWDLTEGGDASAGPSVGSLDLGSVLVVGAGAVASALAYWIRELDVQACWTAIDRDDLVLHNTNRALSSLAEDAGWADGTPGGTPVKKVTILNRVLGAVPEVCWYDDWIQRNPEARPDLVLPLANSRQVRRLIGQRFEPLLLHATTSTAWQAQLHRHIGGMDDCIECRMRAHESAEPVQLACSTAPVTNPDGTSSDAALPFLSGAAGLLLTSALCRLAVGEVARGENHWSLHFDSNHRMGDRSRFECTADCETRMPFAVREQIATGSRWAHILAPPRSDQRTALGSQERE